MPKTPNFLSNKAIFFFLLQEKTQNKEDDQAWNKPNLGGKVSTTAAAWAQGGMEALRRGGINSCSTAKRGGSELLDLGDQG